RARTVPPANDPPARLLPCGRRRVSRRGPCSLTRPARGLRGLHVAHRRSLPHARSHPPAHPPDRRRRPLPPALRRARGGPPTVGGPDRDGGGRSEAGGVRSGRPVRVSLPLPLSHRWTTPGRPCTEGIRCCPCRKTMTTWTAWYASGSAPCGWRRAGR